ncbi:hemerythrin domain-containing protein [Paraburkholderia phymatum]|uniref:Hemerythrin HHE cation binding domain protein n=1 Tax=Paraburkholderia phymatum (strain DSM 17167 / CIP 108236 / LMG 21445 / STM815) TaxID=391038 RepID=B2JWB0_PARP8|nr:hemerythrin domain-containing protein [Paraburkholderia phymatum]ACC75237.1 Hemerythrin HHE cation binding domain protein [Paraburkholderia phymatum STM815]
MTSRLTLHTSPCAGFDEPFEMLAACHERIARTLRLLESLAEHLATAGCDDAAREAACDVIRYFDLASPAHHEDEERHLFPALAAAGQPDLRTLVDRLRAEHREMTRQWDAVRIDLDQVKRGEWLIKTWAETSARWAAFANLYRTHLAAEDRHAYPAATALLGDAARGAMGRDMASRRGVRWPHQ